MPFVTLDGINTRYEVLGEGSPLLMFSPGGFDATLEKWSSLGVYAKTKPLDHLAQHYQCIIFDRRECGQSGGRIEPLTWGDYVRQGKALLDHLQIDKAHLMGGCMGCCPVMAFAVAHPEMVLSMILFWPVGGAKYRINGNKRFTEHVNFVREHGLGAVVDLVARDGKPFGGDPRGGPWASVLKHDRAFAARYAGFDVDEYLTIVTDMARTLLDRDTAPGAEVEDLLNLKVPTLVVPGHDASHATSAARYLEECIPNAEYWDVPVEAQTEENTPQRLLTFLNAHH
jgi:pimeloyl-ACP methyl ester carboxylesterase